MIKVKKLSTKQKALEVNLNPLLYGSFAEIGAGQEVSRYFFQAGGAAGTVAKTMSAYDMKFSDSIYGHEESGRYVCQSRLNKMLNKEYELLIKRLSANRDPKTQFFAFADTVSARNFKGTNECHGWLGVRFQHEAKADYSDLIIHVRMLDDENVSQQQALGVTGVNLVHAALHYHCDSDKIIEALMDNLSIKRIEIDMIHVMGPGFADVDNRLLSFELVKQGYTEAIMFDQKGRVVQPSEALYKKHILALRGSFRPPTLVNVDMLQKSLTQFKKEKDVDPKNVVALCEITLSNLTGGGKDKVDLTDFLARVDLLNCMGQKVLISNYQEYYRLSSYLSRFTPHLVVMVMGVMNLIEIFRSEYYRTLRGGILEAFGILFNRKAKLYVYPMEGQKPGELITCDNMRIERNKALLYEYLRGRGFIVDFEKFNKDNLSIFSREVLQMIKKNQKGWDKFLPEAVVQEIKDNCLFDLPCSLEDRKKLEKKRLKKIKEQQLPKK